MPIYEVMHLTGHKSLAMVQRYTHLAPDYQRRAIEALNGFGHDLGTVLIGLPQKQNLRNRQNPSVSAGVGMVEPRGIEPLTSTLRTSRSPN